MLQKLITQNTVCWYRMKKLYRGQSEWFVRDIEKIPFSVFSCLIDERMLQIYDGFKIKTLREKM